MTLCPSTKGKGWMKLSSTKKEIKCEVIELYGNIRGPEDNWGITVSKIRWNEDAPTVNIRNTNLMKGIIGKGVALSDEETDTLVDVLLERDYGSVEAIEKALERRRTRFDYDEENLVASKSISHKDDVLEMVNDIN